MLRCFPEKASKSVAVVHALFFYIQHSEVPMTSLEVFVWAIAGGFFIVIVSAATAYYQKSEPSKKQLSRDFLLGAAFTGFVYPLIPDTFDDMKGALSATATAAAASAAAAATSSTSLAAVLDPDVKVGPANF